MARNPKTAEVAAMTKRVVATAAFLACCLFAPATASAGIVGSCGLDDATLEFSGTAIKQAECLLRRVKIGGVLDRQPLPKSLRALLRGSSGPSPAAADAALASIPEPAQTELRLAMAQPVSQTQAGQPARYFVIHDTSWPSLANTPFPADLDTDPGVNRLQIYMGPDAVAHMFVNRAGEVAIGHDFSVPWRATKLETQAIGIASRGRFLHVELIQPRRRDPAGSPANDRLSPTPGFSPSQYQRLAALYVIASRRAGQWLIPAFHAAVDAGLADAHDDPQGFDLARFAAAVSRFAAS